MTQGSQWDWSPVLGRQLWVCQCIMIWLFVVEMPRALSLLGWWIVPNETKGLLLEGLFGAMWILAAIGIWHLSWTLSLRRNSWHWRAYVAWRRKLLIWGALFSTLLGFLAGGESSSGGIDLAAVVVFWCLCWVECRLVNGHGNLQSGWKAAVLALSILTLPLLLREAEKVGAWWQDWRRPQGLEWTQLAWVSFRVGWACFCVNGFLIVETRQQANEGHLSARISVEKKWMFDSREPQKHL